MDDFDTQVQCEEEYDYWSILEEGEYYKWIHYGEYYDTLWEEMYKE